MIHKGGARLCCTKWNGPQGISKADFIYTDVSSVFGGHYTNRPE